jgi:hypothetical protein
MPGRTPDRDPVTNRFTKRAGGNAKPNGHDGEDPGIDPVEAGATTGAEPSEPGVGTQRPGSGRGRTAGGGGGTGTAKPKAGASLDLTGLAGVWAGLHVQLARLADTPELAMTEADAKTFMVAWQNYLRHYSIAATQKTVDLITAVSVTAFMYAPRAVAVRRRMSRRPGRSGLHPSPEAAQDSPAGPAQIFAFHPPGAAAAGPGMGPIIDVPPVH